MTVDRATRRGHTAMTAITTSARHLGTNPPGRKDRGAGRESGRGGPGGGSDRRGLRAAGLDRSPARISGGRRDELGGPALRTADRLRTEGARDRLWASAGRQAARV